LKTPFIPAPPPPPFGRTIPLPPYVGVAVEVVICFVGTVLAVN